MPQSAKTSAPTDNTRFPNTSSVKTPVYSSGPALPIQSYSSTITHSTNSSFDVTTSSHDFAITNISTSSAPETHGYPSSQILPETHPYSNTIAEQYESFFGCINDFYDAIVVVEAARIGKTRRIERRQDIPKNILRSGSVFVYSESESRILRWTVCILL
ncbi:hypothetical protein BKA69DRAFT_341017 [Paraphysoderma sedebokerense]|nr:hypothetical protein BKA69DRAFT_341017 [Paraphysoderma sedebokerense]